MKINISITSKVFSVTTLFTFLCLSSGSPLNKFEKQKKASIFDSSDEDEDFRLTARLAANIQQFKNSTDTLPGLAMEKIPEDYILSPNLAGEKPIIPKIIVTPASPILATQSPSIQT